MRVLVKLFFLGLFLLKCVSSQTINCVVCDSSNENERNCGHAGDGNLKSCSSQMGCFTRIYQRRKNKNNVKVKLINKVVKLLENISDPFSWETERGCITTEMTSCIDTATCQKCYTNNCNREVFPSNRNKCLKYFDGTSTSVISEYCNTYGSNDCITFYDNGNI